MLVAHIFTILYHLGDIIISLPSFCPVGSIVGGLVTRVSDGHRTCLVPEWTGPGFMLRKGSASVSSVQSKGCELITRCADGCGSCLVPGRPPTRSLSGPMMGKTGPRPQWRAAGQESQGCQRVTVGTNGCRFAFRDTDEPAFFQVPGWAEMSSY